MHRALLERFNRFWTIWSLLKVDEPQQCRPCLLRSGIVNRQVRRATVGKVRVEIDVKLAGHRIVGGQFLIQFLVQRNMAIANATPGCRESCRREINRPWQIWDDAYLGGGGKLADLGHHIGCDPSF